jgi:GAF domain-containing protein/ANTAR domain-containing protein
MTLARRPVTVRVSARRHRARPTRPTGGQAGEDHSPGPVDLTALTRELAVRLVAVDSLAGAAREVVEAVGRATGLTCAMTVLRAGGPPTVAAFPAGAGAVDEAACRVGDGPALTAIRDRAPVVCRDLTHDPRWPAWRDRAAAHGVRSLLAVPVDVPVDADADVVAAITLYACEAGGRDAAAHQVAHEVAVQIVVQVAAQVGALLAGVLRRRDGCLGPDGPAEHEAVHRAVGILMAQDGCSPVEALHQLRLAAAAAGLPPATVAARLVDAVRPGRAA